MRLSGKLSAGIPPDKLPEKLSGHFPDDSGNPHFIGENEG